MQTITPGQLKKLLEQNSELTLLDVREIWEREEYNIGGIHIPLNEIMDRSNEIPADKDVVVYCRKGIRSMIAIQRLEQKDFKKLINLSGGMDAWLNSSP
jgi:adenylyltransferase/sulfurtransferase